jgi:hypothetical protein
VRNAMLCRLRTTMKQKARHKRALAWLAARAVRAKLTDEIDILIAQRRFAPACGRSINSAKDRRPQTRPRLFSDAGFFFCCR